MSRQSLRPLGHREYLSDNRRASELVNMVLDDELELQPGYQRGKVWTTSQRINLVRSWLLGIPVPSIVLNDRRDWQRVGGRIVCVDGRQRIETAVAWFKGSLAVPATWFSPETIVDTFETPDGLYVKHVGLTKKEQARVAEIAVFPVIQAKATSPTEEAYLHVLLNTAGTPRDRYDLDRAERFLRNDEPPRLGPPASEGPGSR